MQSVRFLIASDHYYIKAIVQMLLIMFLQILTSTYSIEYLMNKLNKVKILVCQKVYGSHLKLC